MEEEEFMYSVFHKKRWQRGASSLAFAFTSVFLTLLLLLSVGCLILFHSYQIMDETVIRIGRDLVVCESMENAQKLADKEAKEMLDNYFVLSDATAHVTYTFVSASGSTGSTGTTGTAGTAATGNSQNGWVRGNFITVSVSAKVHSTTPFTSGYRNSQTVMMIERNGGGSGGV